MGVSVEQAVFDLRHALEVAKRAAIGASREDVLVYWQAGLLHDVLEDGLMSEDELYRAGFPASVVETVKILTRRAGEPYFEYVARVKTDPLATAVKLADLDANLARMDPEHESLRARYENAHRLLREARSNAKDREEQTKEER